MRVLFTVPCLLIACTDDVTFSTASQAGSCGEIWCGGNGPTLAAVQFHELDQTGQQPAPGSGLRIVSFTKSTGEPLAVRVIGARLGGMTADLKLVQGKELEKSRLRIASPEGITFEVTIDTVTDPESSSQGYWENGDDGTKIESYRMRWVKLPEGGVPRELCPIAAQESEVDMPLHDAIVFRGDRYAYATGEVYATGADVGPWFNIACAGDAIMKTFLIRHAEASQGPYNTSQQQRTAAIRMFRADYCGTGPNTEPGIMIDWANRGGWTYLDQVPNALNVEAIWRHDGAACLTHPRLVDKAELACSIPNCTKTQIAYWKHYGDFISTIP